MPDMISVISPIYNAESTLQRCVESILNQTMRNLRIILVDDGSTDSSLSICREFAAADERITVIHKENGGPSSARNAGIEATTTPLLLFIDADDYLEPQCCQMLMDECLRSGADLILGGIRMTDGKKTYLPSYGSISLDQWRDHSSLIEDLYLSGTLNALHGRLYRRDKIKQKFLDTLSLGEDLLFNLAYLSGVDKISMLRDICYNYVTHRNSLSRRHRPDCADINIYLYRETVRFFSDAFGPDHDRNNINYVFSTSLKRGIGMLVTQEGIPKAKKLRVLKDWLSNEDNLKVVRNTKTFLPVEKMFFLLILTKNAFIVYCSMTLYYFLKGVN